MQSERPSRGVSDPPAADPPAADVPAVRSWLLGCVADHLRRGVTGIRPDVPLADYGLDSVTALSVSTDIEDHWGVALAADALWTHPTVDELAVLVVDGVRTG